MKENIHPNYYMTRVTCACGNSFVTGSTQKSIQLDICGVCHPFYTGKQKLIDTAGRVERFKKRLAKVSTKHLKKKVLKKKKSPIKKGVLSTMPTSKR